MILRHLAYIWVAFLGLLVFLASAAWAAWLCFIVVRGSWILATRYPQVPMVGLALISLVFAVAIGCDDDPPHGGSSS